MPCLISTSGHLLEFRKFPSRFGTRADIELVVQDGMGVRDHHFTLRREGVRIVLEAAPDAATTVNGNDVRRANIRDGDRIQVGQLMLIYSNPSGQQNHMAGRLDAEGPIALPSPEAQALPAPATSRQPTAPAASPHKTGARHAPPASATSRQTVPAASQQTQSAKAAASAATTSEAPKGNITPTGQARAQAPSNGTPPGVPNASPAQGPQAATGAFPAQSPAPATQPPRTVPEGIPTASETTPSDSFLAWAKESDAAQVSPMTPRVSEVISAQETASVPPKVTVPKPNRSHGGIQGNSPTTPSPKAAEPTTSPIAIPTSQAAPANPFANAVVQGETKPAAATSPFTQPPQQPAPQQPAPPSSDAPKDDLASVFTQPDDDAEDLANIFLQDDPKPEKPVAPEPVQPVPSEAIPEIPNISEAEKVGAIAEASELPAKDISPIGSVLNKRKQAPAPPPPATPVESTAKEPARKASLLEERKAAKAKKPKKPKRKKIKSTQTMEGRLTSRKLQPKYRLQIPWHKVAIFLCLVFAGAGAYLATSGQHYVDKYMSMLGLKSDPAHHSYLTRLADVAPNMILTADADRIVEFYRMWASEESWVTVGDLETKLKKWATGLRLSDLDHVSIATNNDGHFVAIVSTNEDLNRQDLMRDLGRGVLVSERLGPVTIHEGFVGNSQPVKFAILNPKTMVIGDPDMTMQFISSPVVTPNGPPSDHPTVALSNSPKDLLGFYHTRNGLDTFADWFSDPLRPSIDRLLGFIRTEAADETHLLARVGGDLRVDATFAFNEQSDAETFARGWRKRANRQLGIFKELLGPRAPISFDGVAQDLDQCTITTPGNEAKVVLATTNRWGTLGSDMLKDTFVHLVESLQQNRSIDHTPSLISPEETQARSLALQIVEKSGLAMTKNSPDVTPGQDISELITALSRGVNGSGVYRNVEYRVDGAEKMRGRLLQLLKWQDGQLVLDLKAPPVVEDNGPAMAVKEDDKDL